MGVYLNMASAQIKERGRDAAARSGGEQFPCRLRGLGADLSSVLTPPWAKPLPAPGTRSEANHPSPSHRMSLSTPHEPFPALAGSSRRLPPPCRLFWLPEDS